MSRFIICFICVIGGIKIYGQQQVLDWTEYFKMINRADSLYSLGRYEKSLQEYLRAFQSKSGSFSVGHKYKVARAWSRVGNKDSAYFALQQEAELGFSNLKELRNEPAFNKLHGEKTWQRLLEVVLNNEQKLGRYSKIKNELESVFVLDQKYRKRYQNVIDSFGFDSREMKNLEKQMEAADVKNLKYVSQLIDKYGWISYDIIGAEGSNTIFMVIQHSDSITQEKYLPIMKQAVKQNKAFPNQLAMLEDRVLLRRGSKQIYGTQVEWDKLTNKWKLSPVQNEGEVDKRRSQVGLMPLKDYLKNFGIDY